MIVGCVRNPDILQLGGYTLDNLSPPFFFCCLLEPAQVVVGKKKRRMLLRAVGNLPNDEEGTICNLLMRGGSCDLVLSEFFIQGAAADPQSPGCLFFVPVILCQGILQQFLFLLQNCRHPPNLDIR